MLSSAFALITQIISSLPLTKTIFSLSVVWTTYSSLCSASLHFLHSCFHIPFLSHIKFQLLIFIFKARQIALYQYFFSISVSLLASMCDWPETNFLPVKSASKYPLHSLLLPSTVGRIFRSTYKHLPITFTITISP